MLSRAKKTFSLKTISKCLALQWTYDILRQNVLQLGFGSAKLCTRWSTRWQAASQWVVVSTAWTTATCHRPVTRTTTVLRTRHASSTHTTLSTL